MTTLRPMSEAPRGRQHPILAKYRPHPKNDRTSHLDGRWFSVWHEGQTEGGFDLGWALYPGYGGVPDRCFYGWLPLPDQPILHSAGDARLIERLEDMRDFCSQDQPGTRPHPSNVRRLCEAVLSRLKQPSEDEVERDDVCARCKGTREPLAMGRDPEELCDACYDDDAAALREQSYSSGEGGK